MLVTNSALKLNLVGNEVLLNHPRMFFCVNKVFILVNIQADTDISQALIPPTYCTCDTSHIKFLRSNIT